MTRAGDHALPDAERLLGHMGFVRTLAGDLVRDPDEADEVSQSTRRRVEERDVAQHFILKAERLPLELVRAL